MNSNEQVESNAAVVPCEYQSQVMAAASETPASNFKLAQNEQAPAAPAEPSAAEVAGAEVGDTLTGGWVLTGVSHGKSGGSYGSVGSYESVRGHDTRAFMRRGPVRRACSGIRARRLGRIAGWNGPRSCSVSRRLGRIGARGVY